MTSGSWQRDLNRQPVWCSANRPAAAPLPLSCRSAADAVWSSAVSGVIGGGGCVLRLAALEEFLVPAGSFARGASVSTALPERRSLLLKPYNIH
jgi:hypothetical protein